MDNSAVQIIGAALGQHGPYTFYKAFKYQKNGFTRVVKLGDFFFVKLWSDSDLVCIGELLLLWGDKNSDQVLASLRLYFLPENTPEGRIDHGEDEVLAISEKVVLRIDDLATWITLDAEWTWGRLSPYEPNPKDSKFEMEKPLTRLTDRVLDFKDVDREKEALQDQQGDVPHGPSVVILSFPAYCRYRAVMKRIEGVENEYLQTMAAKILGGVSATNNNTRVLFCRDTFDYPELETHELLCNHLAPKLKGRPRGRRKKRSLSPCSESNESECSISNVYNLNQVKLQTEENSNGACSTTGMLTRRSSRLIVNNSNESKEFLKKLIAFMQSNDTPIGRIPSLGYKELDLHAFFTRVDKLGGYESVTANRLWKSIFDDLSSNYISTSAATVIRRHYERFLLPYELYLKGEEFHPSVLKSTIKRTKACSTSPSEADINDNTSSSSVTSTLIASTATSDSQLTIIPLLPSPSTVNNQKNTKAETKPSSLRSIRVKSDRLKDPTQKPPSLDNLKSELVVVKSEPQNAITELNIIPPNGLTVELITNPKTEDSSTWSPPPAISPPAVLVIAKPPEEKENIATCNTSISAVTTPTKNLDQVPFSLKATEPETFSHNIIKTNSYSNSLLSSVKKRKLDILKEGGLEVTPVKQIITEVKQVKENRPSVIHQSSLPKATIGQLSITITPDKPKEKSKVASPGSFLYSNDQSPPKVLQSTSIYSHSERTVYGNPKDYFTPPAPLAPRFPTASSHKPAGGEILDLTVKSPQKPMFEMMQFPPELSRRILDAPQNLEITLVPPANKPNLKFQNPGNRRVNNRKLSSPHRKQQNGTKLPYSISPATQGYNNRPSSNYNGHAIPKQQQQVSPNLNKPYKNTPTSTMVPNLYSHLTNKMVTPFVPPMDPIYLSAIQNLYPHGQPFMPIPTPEQIQFYTELMACNSQMSRFPFPYHQDIKNSQSIKNINSEKK